MVIRGSATYGWDIKRTANIRTESGGASFFRRDVGRRRSPKTFPPGGPFPCPPDPRRDPPASRLPRAATLERALGAVDRCPDRPAARDRGDQLIQPADRTRQPAAQLELEVDHRPGAPALERHPDGALEAACLRGADLEPGTPVLRDLPALRGGEAGRAAVLVPGGPDARRTRDAVGGQDERHPPRQPGKVVVEIPDLLAGRTHQTGRFDTSHRRSIRQERRNGVIRPIGARWQGLQHDRG